MTSEGSVVPADAPGTAVRTPGPAALRGRRGRRTVDVPDLVARSRGGGVGAAALCGGGGQGDALILHVPAAAKA